MLGNSASGTRGTWSASAFAASSRLCTITQRTYSSTLLPSGLKPVERTNTMPVLRLEFSLSPITSETALMVSPG